MTTAPGRQSRVNPNLTRTVSGRFTSQSGHVIWLNLQVMRDGKLYTTAHGSMVTLPTC